MACDLSPQTATRESRKEQSVVVANASFSAALGELQKKNA
jgi:hypothetical protein